MLHLRAPPGALADEVPAEHAHPAGFQRQAQHLLRLLEPGRGARGGLGFGQVAVHAPVLDQQHDEDETRGHQAIGPAGVEADVPAAGVEHADQADLEEPGGQHHDQPCIHGRGRAAGEQDREGQAGDEPLAVASNVENRGVAVVHEHLRQPVASSRRQRSEQRCAGKRRQHRLCRRPARPAGVPVRFLQEGIGNDRDRKAEVPEHVQVAGALGTGAQQPARREDARKGQQVHRRHHGRIQVATGEDEDGMLAGELEIAEQQRHRDQIVDREDRLVQGNEPGRGRQRRARDGDERDEHPERYGHDDQRQAYRTGSGIVVEQGSCCLAVSGRRAILRDA